MSNDSDKCGEPIPLSNEGLGFIPEQLEMILIDLKKEEIEDICISLYSNIEDVEYPLTENVKIRFIKLSEKLEIYLQ
jgi:hypothetical protein